MMVSTLAIERLWLHIIAYRIWRQNRLHYERRQMEDYVALEIKGLKSNMLKVAQRIERLNTKAAASGASTSLKRIPSRRRPIQPRSACS